MKQFDPKAAAIGIALAEEIVQAAKEPCVIICQCGFGFTIDCDPDDIDGIFEFLCEGCGKVTIGHCCNVQHQIIHQTN
jgi:hypothetical protein